MNIKVNAYAKIVCCVTILLSAFATALRIFLMQSYDIANGFYTNDAAHNIFKYSLMGLAVILFITGYIYIKEEKIQFSLPENRCALPRGICIAAFCGYIVYVAAKLVLPQFQNPTIAELIAAAFSFVSLFFYLSYNSKGKLGDARALLASMPALVILVTVFGVYFGGKLSYVNHTVTLCFAASVFFMLSTLAEANKLLSRAHVRSYLSYAPVAVVLSFALSVPDIVYTITNESSPIGDFYIDIIFLALAIYHLAQLTAIFKVKED